METSIEIKWTSVKEALPNEPGWYIVFAPSYRGGSSGGKEGYDGVMFSQFKITKTGKKSWSIEHGYHQRPGCVLYWMPLPIPTDRGHFETRPGKHCVEKFWVENSKKEAPDDKYLKMESCKHYHCLESLLDYCSYLHMEFPCDAPTDCPLWNECEKCKHWE